MASSLRALGLPVGPVVTMETRRNAGPREALKEIQEVNKVKGQGVFIFRFTDVPHQRSMLMLHTYALY